MRPARSSSYCWIHRPSSTWIVSFLSPYDAHCLQTEFKQVLQPMTSPGPYFISEVKVYPEYPETHWQVFIIYLKCIVLDLLFYCVCFPLIHGEQRHDKIMFEQIYTGQLQEDSRVLAPSFTAQYLLL